MLQLLWLELVTKLAVGLVLAVIPRTAITVLGLPKVDTVFWPRLLGAVLIGISAATFMDTTVRLGHGLALGGSFVINVAMAGGLASMLFLKQGPVTRRGRVVVWALILALMALFLIVIASI